MKRKRLRGVLSHRLFVVWLLLMQLVLLVYLILNGSRESKLISSILSVLSLFAAIHVISRRDKPDYKLTWVFSILVLPIFGGLFYLMTRLQPSARRFRKQVVRSRDAVLRRLPPRSGALEAAEKACPACGRLIEYLQRAAGFPVYPEKRTAFFNSGESYFEALLRELQKAKRYIFIEAFIVEEGFMWGAVLEILKQKARAGVEVRVLFDDFGCFLRLPRGYRHEIQKLGIQCEVFSPLRPALSVLQNNRDHRKIVSIDGEIAFTGGANLADEYINRASRFGRWRDASLLAEGGAAWSLTLMFLQMWELATGRPPLYERFMPARPAEDASAAVAFVQPYADSPLDEENVAENVYRQIISAARRYLYISTPYLIVDDAMISALILAAKGGVDVRILTPEKWDKRLVHVTTRSYYKELIGGGVHIYEYTGGFNHAKTFVSDDCVATVGTVNMDYRSLYLHFECGACLYGGEAVLDIKRDFLETLSGCRRIGPDDLKAGWLKRLVREVLRIFAPLM